MKNGSLAPKSREPMHRAFGPSPHEREAERMRVTTAHRKVECISDKQTGREMGRRGESVVPERCAFNSLAGAGAQPGVQPAVRRSTDASPRGGPPSSSLGAPAQVGRDRLGAYRGKPVRGLEPEVARGPARSVRKRRPPVVLKSVIGFQVVDKSADIRVPVRR